MHDIVLVDDDPDIRMLARMAFELDGHDVVAAGNGLTGLELLRRTVAAGGRPVVVLDVQMPDIDGWEVLESIRADRSLDPIPVVMCTVRAGAADRARGYGHGADAYEAKPFDIDQLLGTVRRLAEMDVERLLARRAALWTEAQA
ncbi:MAG TPA: response regulator [Acidimicrobiales bacterium]|nr:response regulator [Acidimicrobiales bacterium]